MIRIEFVLKLIGFKKNTLISLKKFVIMYTPKALKLNKFAVVDIPTGREIFARFGICTGSGYTGDREFPTNMNKIDVAMYFDALNQRNLDEEAVADAKLDPTK